MSCKHIRNYDVTIVSDHPGDYYWRCSKCGRYGVDHVGGSILKDPDQIRWEYNNLGYLTELAD